jgi:hypothetical protein
LDHIKIDRTKIDCLKSITDPLNTQMNKNQNVNIFLKEIQEIEKRKFMAYQQNYQIKAKLFNNYFT